MHAQHDPLLIAQYAARDPLTAEQVAAASTLVGSCAECASLAADLGAISAAVASEPVPARRRDFRIDAETASECVAPRSSASCAGSRCRVPRHYGPSLRASCRSASCSSSQATSSRPPNRVSRHRPGPSDRVTPFREIVGGATSDPDPIAAGTATPDRAFQDNAAPDLAAPDVVARERAAPGTAAPDGPQQEGFARDAAALDGASLEQDLRPRVQDAPESALGSSLEPGATMSEDAAAKRVRSESEIASDAWARSTRRSRLLEHST